MSYAILFKTAARLGYRNILRVLLYKLGVKTGLLPVKKKPREHEFKAKFFPIETSASGVAESAHQLNLFSWFPVETKTKPNWFKNYFSGTEFEATASNTPWWNIPDFGNNIGDIKTVWELSRFDWVISFALRAKSGDARATVQLNNWLADWCENNPAYCGPNWKCGQEASIRVIHLALAALILDTTGSPSKTLQQFLSLHLQRIRPTLMYALAQDNNHATSEAAALFIGGEWLKSQGLAEGEAWVNTGRTWLNERAQRLILEDGSISQHSVTYHRLMLDTYSIVLLWIERHNLVSLEDQTLQRLRFATQWLFQLTDPDNGDAPNYGANDGAHLFTEALVSYRDFRFSVNVASVLLDGSRPFDSIDMTGVLPQGNVSNSHLKRAANHFQQGGYVTMVNSRAFAFLSYPRYQFRPSQSDAMHLDFSLDGQPILRDNGSFTYNGSERDNQYFSGTKSHNTVEFDSRDQMPRISRFLYGEWLQSENLKVDLSNPESQHFEASYTDWKGAVHQRSVDLGENSLVVSDLVKGFGKDATLRWHLSGGSWQQEGNRIFRDDLEIRITSDADIDSIALVDSDYSLYYMKKEALPAIEVKVRTAGCIRTEFKY